MGWDLPLLRLLVLRWRLSGCTTIQPSLSSSRRYQAMVPVTSLAGDRRVSGRGLEVGVMVLGVMVLPAEELDTMDGPKLGAVLPVKVSIVGSIEWWL